MLILREVALLGFDHLPAQRQRGLKFVLLEQNDHHDRYATAPDLAAVHDQHKRPRRQAFYECLRVRNKEIFGRDLRALQEAGEAFGPANTSRCRAKAPATKIREKINKNIF